MYRGFFLLILLVFASSARADDAARIHQLVTEGKGPSDLAELETLAFAHPDTFLSEIVDYSDRSYSEYMKMAGVIEIAIRLRLKAPQAFAEFWQKQPIRESLNLTERWDGPSENISNRKRFPKGRGTSSPRFTCLR